MRSADIDEINPIFDEQGTYSGKHPPDWEIRKKAVHRNNDYTCQDCGAEAAQGKQLHVHHIRHLSNGGSNCLSNLTTLCVECHNKQHVHDITEELDDPDFSVVDRFRQFVRSVISGVVVLPIHGAAIAVLLAGSVGSLVWFAGVGYLAVLAVGLWLWPVKTAVVYGFAGAVGVVVTQMVAVSESVLVLSAFFPALLALAWWRQR